MLLVVHRAKLKFETVDLETFDVAFSVLNDCVADLRRLRDQRAKPAE